MKKSTLLFYFIVTSVIFNSANAQVNYEYTYVTNPNGPSVGGPEEFFLTNLGNNNYKYVIYDYDSSKFSLFNIDHTPFLLNIPTHVVSDSTTHRYYRLGYITTTLFDCDSSNIEFAMMLDHPTLNVSPNFVVYRTDGTVLFSKDSVGSVFCVGCGGGSYELHTVMNTPDGAKLYLFNYDSSGLVNWLIYGLCDSLPTRVLEPISQLNNYMIVFPNPTHSNIIFKLNRLDNMENYELRIYDSKLQIISSTNISDVKEMKFGSESIANGIYFYTLQNKNRILQSGKFIFSK